MFDRLGKWWQLSIALIVVWTLVIFAYGWLNLPRAWDIPHDPRFLDKLSGESIAILHAREASEKPARGVLVWTLSPMVVPMPNGARLSFPATTTNQRVSIVRGDYFRVLEAEAGERRTAYVLKIASIWLLPCMLLVGMGLVGGLIVDMCLPANRGSFTRGRQF